MSTSKLSFKDALKQFKIGGDAGVQIPDALLSAAVEGKSVAIVGPSQSMDGRGQGKEIDRYDVVVRLSTGALLPHTNPDDFGRKTDVCYVSQAFRRHYVDGLPKHFAQCRFYVNSYQRLLADERPFVCLVCGQWCSPGQEVDNVDPKRFNKTVKDGDVKAMVHGECHPDRNKYETQTRSLTDVTAVKTYGRQFYPLVKRLVADDGGGDLRDLLLGTYALLDILRRRPAVVKLFGIDFYSGLRAQRRVERMHETKSNKCEKKEIYAASYELVKGSLTTVHKDVKGVNLRLFKALLQQYENDNETRIDMDNHLKQLVTNNTKQDLRRLIALKKAQRLGLGR